MRRFRRFALAALMIASTGCETDGGLVSLATKKSASGDAGTPASIETGTSFTSTAPLVSNNSAALSGVVSVPTGLISNNGSSYRIASTTTETPVAGAEVSILDSSGSVLAGPVKTDSQGRYAFEKSPLEGNALVQAQVISGAKTYRLEAVARLSLQATAAANVDAATTLTTEKFKQVIARHGGRLEAVDASKLQRLAALLKEVLLSAGFPDLSLAPERLAMAFDKLLQSDDGALQQARQTDAQVATPIVRYVKYLTSVGVRPMQIAFAPDGALYVAVLDGYPWRTGDPSIWQVGEVHGDVRRLSFDAAGNVLSNTSFATIDFPFGIAVDAAGNVYVSQAIGGRTARSGGGYDDLPGRTIWRIDPQGNKLAISSDTLLSNGERGFRSPGGLAVGPDGKIYVASSKDSQGYILRFDPAQIPVSALGSATVGLEEFVRSGQSAANDLLSMSQPGLLSFGPDGTLWVPDSNAPLWKVSSDGSFRWVTRTKAGGIALDWAGSFYLTNSWGDNNPSPDGSKQYFFSFRPDGTLITQSNPTYLDVSTQQIGPSGAAFDRKGNLHIADFQNGTVVKAVPSD